MDKKELESKIKEFAFENAVKFNGTANNNAIIGKLFTLDKDIKSKMKEVMPIIDKIVKEVNSLDLEKQKKELLKLNPNFEEEQKEKKKENKESREDLPPIEGAELGKVTTRLAPEPSKFNHVGHAISFLINYIYAKKYDGKCILRFDDTNPEKESQEYVDAMKEDCLNYLGIDPDKVIFASDDIPKFYEFAKKLINEDNAYVCDCESEQISKDRREMNNCIHRDKTSKESLKLWNAMVLGKNTDAVLRLKIDMAHKNAVMRDPVIFRVITTPHYRQKDKYKVWPMYDFETTIEEGLHHITHVFRSNEFDSRIELQKYISKLLGLPDTEYRHYGRYTVSEGVTQGREIRQLIESGKYSGWDDIRLVTLKALKRRGIVKDTYYKLARIVGMSKTQNNIDFTVIASINRQILDKTVKRFFFMSDYEKIKIKGAPIQNIKLKLHPEIDSLGFRNFKASEDFYITKQDLSELKSGKLYRLMDCLNFKKSAKSFEFDSLEYESYKNKGDKIMHFLPADDKQLVQVEILMDDAKTLKGIAESNISKCEVGEVIQFERFGFCRLDSIENDKTNKNQIYKFWFTHK